MTLALTTWNHAPFVETALRAALAQDYSPLEIIVSDDGSSDGTWEIVQRIAADYRGPHRLRLNRNPINLGIGAHNDFVMQMAQGAMVVLSAGDDYDEPDRVSLVAREAARGARAVTAPLRVIENRLDAGVLIPPPPQPITPESLAATGGAVPGGAFARAVYEIFGPMGAAVVTAEDIVLGFRAALLGPIAVLERPLLNYRRHGASLLGSSGPLAASAQEYRRGFRRMIQGVIAARQVQLADLAVALRYGLLTPDRHADLERRLKENLELSSSYRDVLEKKSGSAFGLLGQMLKRRIRASDAAKILLTSYAPRLWYAYQRRRLRTN